jgi:hypothetical protein
VNGSGEITGAKAVSLTIAATKCSTSGGGGSACTSAGAKSEEVKLELEGAPAYIESKKAVGLVLKHKGGGNFTELTCGGEKVKVRGSVIGVLSFANVSTTEYRLVLSQKKGVQEPTEAEGTKDILEAEGSGSETYAWEQAGYQVGATESSSHIDNVTTSEATKLKAILETRGLPEFKPSLLVALHRAFEGKAVRSPIFELASGSKWEYSGATIKGNLIGPNELALTWVSKEGGEGACYSGPGPKELVTRTLIGRLGYLNKATKEVGLLLESVGPLVAKCGALFLGSEEWSGAVLGKTTPVHEFTSTLKLEFNLRGRGLQELEKFEGETVSHHLTDRLDKSYEESLGLWATVELTGFPAAEFRIEA